MSYIYIYIYDISRLRVKQTDCSGLEHHMNTASLIKKLIVTSVFYLFIYFNIYIMTTIVVVLCSHK